MSSKELNRRLQVFNLFKSGVTNAKSIQNITKISLPTIYDIKRRIKSELGVKRRVGSGRPSKLSTTDKKRISNLANSNPKISCARIGQKIQ